MKKHDKFFKFLFFGVLFSVFIGANADDTIANYIESQFAVLFHSALSQLDFLLPTESIVPNDSFSLIDSLALSNSQQPNAESKIDSPELIIDALSDHEVADSKIDSFSLTDSLSQNSSYSFIDVSQMIDFQESKIDNLISIYHNASKVDEVFVNDVLELKIDNNPVHSIKPFILITSLYNETDLSRMQEYITCLDKNLAHKSIGKIHVMYDTSKDDLENKLLQYLKSKNIEISFIVGRPTFGSLFSLVNQLYSDKKIIVSNGDIYFNESLSLLDNYDLHGKFLALTRWNVKEDNSIEIFKQFDKNGVFRPSWSYQSQDTWIFQAPIKKFNFDDIQLGTFLCDGLIAFQAYQIKLHVFNPCTTIQCCHLHLSGVRHYERIAPDQALIMSVPWTTLEDPPNKNENYLEKYQLKEYEFEYFKKN